MRNKVDEISNEQRVNEASTKAFIRSSIIGLIVFFLIAIPIVYLMESKTGVNLTGGL